MYEYIIILVIIIVVFYSTRHKFRYPEITYSKDPSNNFKGILLRNYFFTNSEILELYDSLLCNDNIIPKKWYDLLNELCEGLFDEKFQLKAFNVDSNGNNKTTNLHNNNKSMEHNINIIVSFGASCIFSFDEHLITLHSGDIYITNVDKKDITINKICDESMPRYFDDIFSNNAHCYVLINGNCKSMELRKK